MKVHILIIVSLTLLLIQYGSVYGEGQIKYTIQIGNDGSAMWIIRHTGINVSIDLEFQNKIVSLVDAAKNETRREMTADIESITFTPSGSYIAVEYKFYWRNFSKIENTTILIGDVFLVEDFFLQLYGNGEIYMTYPSQYVIEAISPPLPNERNDSLQTLTWWGIQDFANGQPTIVLREKSLTLGFLEILGQNVIIIASLGLLTAGSLTGFFVFKRRKKKEREIVEMPKLIGVPKIESAEEKIVNMLKSAGGSLYQSAIVDQCKFSKAKTSQLLMSLEGKGIVSRYKQGRDKIVMLVGQDK